MGQARKTTRESLTIPNDARQLGAVRDFVGRMVKSSPLTASDANKLVLAVDEAVTNIMEHGYGKNRPGDIEIEIEFSPEAFQIRILDEGKFFNPELAPDPDVLENLRLGRKRGLGIFLMRQIMDEIRYRYKDGVRNELTLVKYVQKQTAS